MVGTGSKAHAVSTAWRLDSLQLPSCVARARCGALRDRSVTCEAPWAELHDGAVMDDRDLHYTTLMLARAGLRDLRRTIHTSVRASPASHRGALAARHLRGTAGGVLAGVDLIPGCEGATMRSPSGPRPRRIRPYVHSVPFVAV